MINFYDIEILIDRIKVLHSIKTDSQLSELIGISAADFSLRKKRNTLFTPIILWAINERLNLNWLVYGKQDDVVDTTTVQAVASLREILASDDPVWKPAILANLAAFRQAVDQKREMEKLRQEVAAVKAMDRPRCPNPTAGAIDPGSPVRGPMAKAGSKTVT